MFLSGCMVVMVMALCCHGYPDGPPVHVGDLCSTMFPTQHGVAAQTSTPPYEYVLSNTCYKEGSEVQVLIKANAANETLRYFEGFFAQVQKPNENTMNYGKFMTEDTEYSKPYKCFNKNDSTIGHMKKEHFVSRKFTWIAPANLTDSVKFRATIVKSKTTFWTEVMSPELTFDATCEDMTLTENAMIQDRGAGSHEEDTTEPTGNTNTGSGLLPLLFVTIITMVLALVMP